ncbi:MAG TPA: hypothetical protein VFM36_13450 [Thermoanaerobaculia bacterium]|nr:hypothetical protein [Thermoanaerobaculia bacterium]
MDVRQLGCSALLREQDTRNMRAFNYWTFAMAIWFGAATILLAENIVAPQPAAWIFPLGGLVIALFTVRAYVHFLRNADELLRKIHLEGLAFGVGAAVIFMPVYRLCERLGAPKLDSVDALIVIILAWGFGQWRASSRYIGEEPK